VKNKNEKAVKIYDQIAEDYAKTYDPIDNEGDLIFPSTFLSYLKPGSFIVDLGCGTGFSAGYFMSKGMKVEGADLSSGMINIAKRNYPDIKFSIADMRKFKPEIKTDAVWAGYSVFHFEQSDFEKTLKTVKTYLKPQGILGIVVQEGEGEIEIPEPFLPNEKIYLHLYTEQELRMFLDRFGFEVIETKRKLPKNPKEFTYNKLLLIARNV
jgi:ubiquinone/menaquinone biosynthesis C-methylase UbiE